MKNLIGYLAAFVGTILMLPQLWKMLKTKRVNDVSWMMLSLYCINCALWLIYGFSRKDLPMIGCNSVGLIISLFQLFLKQKFSEKN